MSKQTPGPSGFSGEASQPIPSQSQPQNSLTNDSFQMGATPILATTRPYDNNAAAVEKFLTTGVSGGASRANPQATAASFRTSAGGATTTFPLQTSAHTSFAAPLQSQGNSAALHPAPPSLASTAQPRDGFTSPDFTAGPPLLSTAHVDPRTMTGSGRPRATQGSGMPVLTATSSSATPAAPVFTSFQKHTGRSPTSQTGATPDFPTTAAYGSEVRGGGVAPLQRTNSANGPMRASDESLYRSPRGSPRPMIQRTRSDRELNTLFASELGSSAAGRVSPTRGGRAPYNTSNGGRASPSLMPNTHNGSNAGSAGPRNTYNPAGSYHPSGPAPSSRQSGSMSGSKPQWLNAVERMRRADTIHQPVLPLDQSKLGMAAHRAQQQGVLTAAQLRSHEAQVAAGNARTRSQPPQQVQSIEPLYASAFCPSERRSPSGRSGSPMLPLRAQEVTLQGSDSRSNGIGSEGSHWRRGHVHSVATAPLRAAVSTGARVSAGGRVSPHSGNAPSANMNNNIFNPQSLSYSAMNSDPFLGARGPGSASRKQPSNRNENFGDFVHKSVATLPTLFASEVHEAQSGSTNKDKDTGKDKSRSKSTRGRQTGGGGGGDSDDSDHSRDGRNNKANANTNRGHKKDHLEDDERDEQMLRSRDYNALHAIPWEQRRTTPMTGFGTRLFAMLASPRIWEKMDWTLRGAVLTILPTMVLALEPTTAPKFPMPSNLAFTAFWITMPTFGAGLRELFIAIKGFCMGLVFVLITIAIDPPDWGIILCLFFFTLICAFVAEQSRKTIAYVLCSSLMQLISNREITDYKYVGIYYQAIFVALSFGTAAFLVPFIRWSSRAAKHYLKALGNALSIEVQGMASSFWVRNPLERELNVVRLRQLRHTAEECMKKISVAISETGYEPHSGKFVGMLKTRFQFCQSIHNVLGSLSQVIELLCDNPELTDTPMCNTFGAQISEDLAVIASAMDTMILKIVDFSRVVTMEEIFFFQQVRERFQEALSRVREDVILTNEDYETDESDIFLGFFMFSIDELCETIASFHDELNPRSNILFWLTFWIRDVKSSIMAFRSLCLTMYYNRSITRRLKEAIKLSLCMALPVIFQVYALKNQQTSPMAGAAIIAFMYNPTGSESFHYCSGRLLGTVLGSTASLLSVQIADGRRGVLYVFIALLSIISCYVQAAPEFYALGNAMACSTISITTQYRDQNAAMLRIQQNCFAILIYFLIISVIWPMRGRTKVKMGLDVSLRCLRESSARLLCNLDMPYDAEEVVTDVTALLLEMRKKIGTQDKFIPGATEEPTLSSAEFPADAWKRIVDAEKSIHSTLAMMRFAYREFMSSRADANTELSVHWVVLHRIAPHAKDLSDLIYATIDLHLLSLSKTTEVPASQLTRLRRGMIESQHEIMQTYIETISHKIAGGDSDADNGDYDYEDGYYDDDDGNDGSFNSSLPAPPPPPSNQRGGDDQAGSGMDGGDKKKKTSDRGSEHSGHGETSSGTGHGDDDNDDSSENTNADAPRRKKKKKKVGYLGYKLSAEEAKALRDFITNGRIPGMSNASFFTDGLATNTSFSPTSFANAGPAGINFGTRQSAVSNMGMKRVPQALADSMADNPAWKTGAFAQHGNNDGRLMALAGNDDSLAARLRKKHHLNKKSDDADDNDDEKKDVDDVEDLSLGKNKSFANNRSFDKSTSFFLKNTSFLGKMFRRNKNDHQHDLDDEDGHSGDDDDKVTGSPAERQLTEAMSRASTHSSPQRRRRSRQGGDGKLNASSSTLTAADVFSPKSARSRSLREPLSDDDHPFGRTRHGDQENLLATTSQNAADPTKVDTDEDAEMPEIFGDSALKASEPADVSVPANTGPPHALSMFGTTISTAHATADLKKATAGPEDKAAVSTPKRTGAKTVDTDAGAGGADNDAHAVKSSNSSGGTGNTEKKVISGKEHTSSSTKTSPDRELEKPKKTLSIVDGAKQSTTNDLSFGQRLLQSTLGGGDGSQDPPDGALGNISFFDPESGEFILTNHDIHSLEAFLFGTRALVVYLNDLQKSILEMQHSNELAKKL